jgi:hypothetical protein
VNRTGRAFGLPAVAARWIVPAVLIGSWLAVITSRQVALFPPAATPVEELLPVAVIGGLVVLAAALRIIRPSLATHVALLTGLTFGAALVAAQLGQPLANATAGYCGDLCRTAIFGRFVTFFGWPVVVAIVLQLIARSERRAPDEPGADRAAWTTAWAIVALVAGMATAVAWWRIILPNG